MSLFERTDDDGRLADRGKIPLWRSLSFHTREKVFHYAGNAATVLFLIVMAFPVVWILTMSFRPNSMITALTPPIIPRTLTLEHYQLLIQNTNFPLYFYNSLVLAGGVVTVTATAATLGGYGLNRIDIPFKKTFARLILFGYMFPGILLAIPMFIFWRRLDLMNTRIGLVLAVTAGSLPFSLWLMWKFFQTVPESLEESARMAGASRFRAMYEIALPQAFPGIVAVSIFAFAGGWSAYTIPLILMPDQSHWVLTVGLDQFVRDDLTQWGRILAGSMIMAAPPIFFLFTMQKYLLGGLRAGGDI